MEVKKGHAVMLALGLIVAAFAQQPAGDVAQFKSETTLIHVPVVVRDREGRTVGNLRAEDFRLLDDRKEQRIAQFDVHEMRPVSRRQAESGSAALSAAPAADGLPTRFVGYLADDINLVPEDLVHGRSAAIRSLDTMSASTRAAVYTASGSAALDFTGDRDVLHRTLLGINSLSRATTWLDATLRCRPMTYFKAERISAGDPGAIADCLGPYDAVRGSNLANATPSIAERGAGRISGPIANAGSEAATIGRQNAIRADAESVLLRGNLDAWRYLHALESLIDKLALMPGERLIVLLSPGMYVPEPLRAMQEAVIDKAIRARVVISGVDVRGVFNYYPIGPDPTTGNNRYGLSESSLRVEFMTEMAKSTGGQFLRGNNDLDLQLRRVASVPEYVYVLAFYPESLKADGKVHALAVSLRNAKGLTVESRSNYVAPSKESAADEMSRKLDEALFSSEEAQELPVQIRTSFVPGGSSTMLKVSATMDASKLRFRRTDGRNHDTLAVLMALFDSNGKYLDGIRKVFEFHMDDQTLAVAVDSGIEARKNFDVKPGTYLLRFVARDSGGPVVAQHSTRVDVVW